MSAERTIASHLRLAAEALRAAEILFRIGNRNAAYECEQSVEHLILAVGQSEKIHFGRALHHRLDAMVDLLPDSAAKSDLKRLTWLEGYATAYRYPQPSGGLSRVPDGSKFSAALTSTRTLLGHLARHFEIDISIDAEQPAAHTRPPGTSWKD